MYTKALQSILTILVLLGIVYLHGRATSAAGCTAKAWVRAPDLAPNTIVRGDARIKISAECPAVEGVSLGLRFKERSFIKALRSREDVRWLNPEHPRLNFPISSPWPSMSSHFANKSIEENYKEIATNKDLWVVREEERLVFETTQPIDMGNRDHSVLRDAVQDISILVPSTNFPPSPGHDIMANDIRSFFGQEIMFGEWIYEYFAQISFSNGTTREIPAGFTAFQSLYDPVYSPQGFISATVPLKSVNRDYMGESTTENLAEKYSMEISDESGLIFSAGTKKHVVNAIITRTGIARTFSQPLGVFSCVKPTSPSRWAAEYGVPTADERANAVATFSFAFLTMPDDERPAFPPGRCFFQSDLEVAVMMPNSTLEEIQANKIVTTTSAPFTMTIDMDNAYSPTFETHYQVLANLFTFSLQVPREENEDVGLGDLPSIVHDFGLHFEEDEEPWVPWGKESISISRPFWMRRTYEGSIPVMVHPTGEGTALQHCLHASLNMPGQAVLPDRAGCQHSSIHYLDEGARGPTFVDPSVVHELLAQDPAERESHAPILQPVVSSPPEGEELVYRYYGPHLHGHQFFYVGETWAKNVANKNGGFSQAAT